MQPVYPPMFIHLELDQLYAAEHILLALEQKGFLDNRLIGDLKKGRRNALTAIKYYLRSNLTEDGTAALEKNRYTEVYAGSKIIERAGSSHLSEDQRKKYEAACHLVASLKQDPKLIKTYSPAFTPESYQEGFAAQTARLLQLTDQGDPKEAAPAETTATGDAPANAAPAETTATGDAPANAAPAETTATDEVPANAAPTSEKPAEAVPGKEPSKAVVSLMPLKVGAKKKPWAAKRSLISLACLLLCTAIISAGSVREWFANITFERRSEGSEVVHKLLEDYAKQNLKAHEVIEQIKDEKKLYRFAENEILSGNLNLAEGLIQHLIATTDSELMAMFSRLRLAEILLSQGHFHLARQISMTVEEEIQSTPYGDERPAVMQLIAMTYLYEGKPELFEYSLAVLADAEATVYQLDREGKYEQEHYKISYLASINQVRVLVYILLQRYQEALQAGTTATEYFGKISDFRGIALTNILEGLALHQAGGMPQTKLLEAERFAIRNKEHRLYVLLNVVRRQMHRCHDQEERVTGEILTQHFIENGDKLPLILDKLIAEVPCP